MSETQRPAAEFHKIAVDAIVEALMSDGFYEVLASESIGGNAGENHAAVNGFAHRDIGNPHYIPEAITKDNRYSEVTFAFDYGNSLKGSGNPPQITEVFSSGLSPTGKSNIEEALKIVNQKLKEDFSKH